MAFWPGAGRGLVLLLPGRTEFVEKYAPMAGRLQAMGFAAAALDWRGQGLSARPDPRPMSGHVEGFSDYQHDLLALTQAVAHVPGPRAILSHSMGGCIGLRALMLGTEAKAAVFSAPMWGIGASPAREGLYRPVARAAALLGLAQRLIPGGRATPYLLAQDFRGNALTSDPEQYALLRRQVGTHPELGQGAPSLGWLNQALIEMALLARGRQPSLPILTLLGGDEAVVSSHAIRSLTSRQPGARLVEIPGARHEVLIERPELREQAWAEIGTFLDRHLPAP